MKSKFFFPIALLALIVGLFLFSCTTPTNLNSASNTEIYLVARTSTQLAGNQGLVDSVGNPITAGFYCNFPAYIDSVQLELVSTNGSDSLLKTFTSFSTMKYTDTLWQTIVFGDTGMKTIKGVAYIKNNKPYSDSISVHIYGKPVNHRPVLLVSGQTAITQKGVCVLTVTAIDTDLVQKVSVSMLYGPKGSRLTDTIFTWTPDSNFSGTDSAVFVAQDNGYPVMYDTVRTIITVTGVTGDHAPKWANNSVNLSGNPGTTIVLTLKDICTDPDGDSLQFSLLAGLPVNDTVVSGIYTFLPSQGDTGLFLPRIVAKDPIGLADTMTIHLTIKTTAAPGDTTGPVIRKFSGLATGGKTSSPYDTLVYTVTDQSGVDTVSWTLNGAPSGILAPDANGRYSIKALLTVSHTNTIILIAYDKSTNHNKSADTTVINYNRPPVISGAPSDTTIQQLSTIQFTVTAKDPDSDKVSLKATTLPTGATFDTSSGVFKWITSSGQNGAFSVVFNANDGLDTTTKSVSIVISNSPPPIVTKNPVDTSKCLGSTASFFVNATGTGLTYQWENSTGKLTDAHYKGATTNTLTIDTVKATDANTYTCVVTNSAGGVTSSTGAKLTINTYTVKFNTNGGSPVDSQMVMCNAAATAPTPPTKTNYSFGGWYSDSALTSPFIFNTPITGATTLYVKWTVNGYTVTFNKNDSAATGTMAPQTVASGSSAALTTNAFTKAGWAFAGWATSAAGAVAYADGASYTMGTANVTLYAKWTANNYAVTFLANDAGATGTMAPQTIASGSSAALTANGFTKPGSNFAGWATTATGAVAYADGASYTMGTASVTLYAKWTVGSFTVAFDKNDAAATGTMAPQIIASGASATLTANGFTKAGWTFAGWATTASGTVAYADGASYTMGSANVTLFAKWTANNYTVTFLANDAAATGTMTAQTIASGSSAALTTNGFTKAGWTFAGWSTTATGVVAYADGTSYTMGAANVTLYAKWTANNFTVTFLANDPTATGTMTAQTIASGSSAALTTNGFTKAGWTFAGWSTTATGAVAYADGASYSMGTANVTLYAKWTANNYTITFLANDAAATGTMTAQTIASGSSAALTTNGFTKAGWTFAGWSTTAAGAIAYANGASYTMGTANVTLYANWTVNYYTITFNKNDANATGTMNAESIVSGSSANLTTNGYSDKGFAFAGWATSSTGAVAYANGANYVMGTANVTLYAKWNVSKPTITTQPALQGNYCQSASLSIGATGSGNLQYQWYNTGVSLANGTTTSITVTATGNYYCIVTDGNGGTVQSNTVTYNGAFTISITFNPVYYAYLRPACDTACQNGIFTLTATTSGGTPPITYFWGVLPYNGWSDSTQTTSQIAFEDNWWVTATPYAFSCLATDSKGCTVQGSVNVQQSATCIAP